MGFSSSGTEDGDGLGDGLGNGLVLDAGVGAACEALCCWEVECGVGDECEGAGEFEGESEDVITGGDNVCLR